MIERIDRLPTGEVWQQALTDDGDLIAGFAHRGFTVVDRDGRIVMASSEPGWDVEATIKRVLRYRAAERGGPSDGQIQR
jgi:hypothetical protein